MLKFETPLGRLVSEIISPFGSDVIEIVDGLEYTKEAPGGYMSLSGTIDPARVSRRPDVYQWGATWRLRRYESGDIVCAGRITDLAISADKALIRALGHGTLADRQAQRLCYESMSLAEWTPQDGAPYGYTFNLNSSIQCSSTPGKLLISIGSSAVLATNDQNGLVFWAAGNTPSHITFTISLNRAPASGADYSITVDTAVGPSASKTTQVTQLLNSGTSYTVDANLNPGDGQDLVAIMFKYTGAGVTLPRDLVISITNVQMFYIASDGTFTGSQMVSDICGRLGISTALVQTTIAPIVPADFKQTTFRAPLDFADAFSDYRTIMRDLGVGPVCDSGPWSTRTWTAVDPELPIDPVPLDRYNRVPVQFTYTNGATGFLIAAPQIDPLSGVSEYPQVLSLQGTYPDATIPSQFGVAAATYLASLRYAGQMTIHSVVDSDGSRHSAHDVEAGDLFYLQYYGITPRGRALRGGADSVNVTFDDRLATLDRLLAAANRAQALLGF